MDEGVRERHAKVERLASGVRGTWSGVARGGSCDERSHNPAERMMIKLCAMFDESYQCTIVLLEEGLGYGLVVPFLAYRFALWFRIMKT